MENRIIGSLLQILKVSRVAWYRADGITAYYEQPSPGVPGVIFVNGEKLTSLIVDPDGRYADVPSPQVQHRLVANGVDLDEGWTCGQEAYGQHINNAVEQSKYQAVRHHDGKVSIQCVDEEGGRCAIIFVNGLKRWRVDMKIARRAIAEMGLSTTGGWYPVQTDLLALQQVEY